MPDYQFDNLAAVLIALPLLGKIKKTLPVFRPLPEQMQLIGAAIAANDPGQFQLAMMEASKPTGHAEITLLEYSKTNNSATVEKEEISDLLVNFCAAVRRTAGLQDKRVAAYIAEKTAADESAAAAEAALKGEASDDGEGDENGESNPVDGDNGDENNA